MARDPYVIYGCVVAVVIGAACVATAQAQRRQTVQPEPLPTELIRGPTSFADVTDRPFAEVFREMSAEKDELGERQSDLLEARYDLADRPASGVTMSRGKPVQGGVRVRLPRGTTWDELAAMTPAQIAAADLWPDGFKPLPHPNHPEGGMLFPQTHIDEILEQESRDLARFDLAYDIPDRFLPEFPGAIFLTTRPELGDVSQDRLVTNQNYYELFSGILNPKQLDGLRLLVTPFAQQQFNLTGDRRSEKPSLGVTCFDCHANGHTNAATHLVGDIRPQPMRRRIDTPSLRGVGQQRLFGSQRALRSIEDFTEFEQRAAYFDGDPVIAQKKGVNILERGSQVHAMAELQNILDFPPAPKLDVFGKLDPTLATEQELRGEEVFFNKGRCAECHVPPAFTDHFMHDLQAERFYDETEIVSGAAMADGGATKTFPLRGIKDSPPYLHDGRLLTLEDTVEFFNLVLGVQLTAQEKEDLVRYMYTL